MRDFSFLKGISRDFLGAVHFLACISIWSVSHVQRRNVSYLPRGKIQNISLRKCFEPLFQRNTKIFLYPPLNEKISLECFITPYKNYSEVSTIMFRTPRNIEKKLSDSEETNIGK